MRVDLIAKLADEGGAAAADPVVVAATAAIDIAVIAAVARLVPELFGKAQLVQPEVVVECTADAGVFYVVAYR